MRVSHTDPGYTAIPPVQVTRMTWSWCAQTFQALTATSSEVSGGHVVSETLHYEGRLAENGTILPEEGLELADQPYRFIANSTGVRYIIASGTSSLGGNLVDFLKPKIHSSSNLRAQPHDFEMDGLGAVIYNSDSGKIAEDLATTMSNLLRNQIAGENLNATAIDGTAYGSETFIQVEWQWAVLPLIATLLTSVLLASSIWITTDPTQPQLKNSALGLAVHSLQEQVAADIEKEIAGQVTSEKLEKAGKHLKVVFAPNSEGRWRLVGG